MGLITVVYKEVRFCGPQFIIIVMSKCTMNQNACSGECPSKLNVRAILAIHQKYS